MKSFLTWIAAVIIGGGIGYGISFIVDVNLYLLIGIGVLVGSSMGVTINIHRDDDFEMPPEEYESANTEQKTRAAEKTE